jgi:hypothetical protein
MSTYSDLKIELIGTGEQAGTWGTTTNTNLGTAIEEAITGTVDVSFSSGTVTLTLTDSNATQSARHLRLNLTGTSGGAQNLIVPAIQKQYIVNNGTADTITVKNSSGTGIGVPSGKTMILFNNGTNVIEVTNFATSQQINLLTGASAQLTGIVTAPSAQISGFITTSSIQISGFATIASQQITGNSLIASQQITGLSTIASENVTRLTASSTAVGALTGTSVLGGGTIDGTNSVGFKAIPPVGTKTGSYTLTVADVGKYVQLGSSGAIVVPNSTFSEGDAIALFNNTSGNITITLSITTAYLAGTDADKATLTLATRGVATILFISGTVCVVSGNVS